MKCTCTTTVAGLCRLGLHWHTVSQKRSTCSPAALNSGGVHNRHLSTSRIGHRALTYGWKASLGTQVRALVQLRSMSLPNIVLPENRLTMPLIAYCASRIHTRAATAGTRFFITTPSAAEACSMPLCVAWKQAGRWGGRRDSNPQQQAPQAWTLPLSYDHQSHRPESRKMACAGQVPPQVRPHMGHIRAFRGRHAHARHARHEAPTPPGNQTPRAVRHPPARAARAGRA